MKAPTLAEHFQQAGIQRYRVFASVMRLDKKQFKSKVQKLSLCTHNHWYRLLHEPGSWKSMPAVGTALHYICMGNLNLIRVTSKNWNEANSGGGKHTGLDLMQKVFALDDELAMAGKSMTGAV